VNSDNLLAGVIAAELGFVTQAQLDACIAEQEKSLDPSPLGSLLVTKGHLTQPQLRQVLDEQRRRLAEFPDVGLFGQLALQKAFVSASQLGEAIREQLRSKERPMLGQILLRKGYLKKAEFAEIIGSQNKTLFQCPQCDTYVAHPQSVQITEAVCPRCRQLLAVVTPETTGTHTRSGDTTMFFKVPLARLGKFEVIGEVARGAMGIVFKAHDSSLDRTVALKVLKEGDTGPEFIKRLHREASLAAKLRHPNIVSIYEVGQAEGLHYLCMDFIEGRDLALHVKEKKLDRRAVLSLLETIARAVHYAHAKGVIHRDLKPSNILVTDAGVPFITDFGLAKGLDDAAWMTKEGVAVGTPLYMPPEQVVGALDKMDMRSDVYSLGILLYEFVVGRPPFTGASTLEIYQKILSDDPVRPAVAAANCPPDLEAIILMAIERERDLRYATAEDFAFDIERFLAGEPVMAARATPARLLWRRIRKHAWRIGSLAAAVLLTAGVVLGWRAMERAAEIRDLENHAASHYDAGKFEEARAAYDRLLAVDPRHATANQRIGELRRRVEEERLAAAKRVEQEAVARDREAKAKRQAAAKPFYDAGFRKLEEAGMLAHQPGFSPQLVEARLKGAVQDFDHAVDRDADYADAFFLRGRCKVDLGHPAAAEKDFSRAIEITPGNPSAYLERGKIFFMRAISASGFRSKWDGEKMTFVGETAASEEVAAWKRKAAADFQKAVDVSQRTDDRSLMGAFMALADGDAAGAVRGFTLSISENEANPDAFYGRGFAHLLLSDYPLAIRFLQDALRLKPNLYAAHTLIGIAHFAEDRFDLAEKSFRRALEAGDDRLALGNLATCCAVQRRYDEAIAAFDALLRREPDDVRLHLARASLLYSKGDGAKAVEAAERIVQRFPRDAEALSFAAICYAQAGLRDVAINYFDRAVQIQPTDDATLANYATILLEDRQPDRAFEMAKRAVAANPKNAHAQCAAGAALGAGRQPERALPYLDEAIRLEPTYAGAHLRRGITRLDLGRTDDAVRDLQRAATLDPKLKPIVEKLLAEVKKP
jgi:tetratricopeptide (TPR) repeat protein